jgi:methionyl-tRNA formyltransferase
MSRPRIVYMGTPEFAVPALRALVEHAAAAEVVAVVTQPDRPAGRGRHLTPSAVKAFASAQGLPVLQPTRLRGPEFAAQLAAFAADLFIVAAYGRILPQSVLDVPRLACINIHASILPRWRGASPIAHALWHGDAETGVGIMQMEAGLDTGPVYATARTHIAADATCGSLTAELAELGADALLQALPGIVAGTCRPVPQVDAAATFAPLLTKAHGQLDWRQPAAQLARQVRAFDPWPGTFAYAQATEGPLRRVGIMRAHAAADMATVGQPGSIVAANAQGLYVACGTGVLAVDQVKPEGRGAMPAAAWVAGRGITPQDQFALSSKGPPV